MAGGGLNVGALALFAAAVVTTACGRTAPPVANQSLPAPIELSGTSVLVLPVQVAAHPPVPGLDQEIAFWLADRGPMVRWTFPPELHRILARSPGVQVRPGELPVGGFHRAELRRIGDPLFGDLRRLAALVDARLALIPVAAGIVPGPAGGVRIEIMAAVVDALDGNVRWFGVVAGDETPDPDRPGLAASGAQALARALLR